jgi:uncharacterized protein YkwD
MPQLYRALPFVLILLIAASLAACGDDPEVIDLNAADAMPSSLEARCEAACDRVYQGCEQVFLHDDNSAMSEPACVERCVEEDFFHGGEWCVATEAECKSQPRQMIDACVPDDYHPEACQHLGAWDHELVEAEQRVVELVNELRDAGTTCPGTGATMPSVGPVQMDVNLQCAARLHTVGMEDTGTLSHTGEGGSSVADRVAAAGYEATRGVGENIAQGYTTPETVVEGWRTSDTGHCENMMDADWRDIGVGMYRLWWTQKFGR